MARQQRIGLFFGTFDPVSRTQVSRFLKVLDAGEADQLLILPVRSCPGQPCVADAEDRWKMLVAACSRDKRLIPCRLALDREPADGAALIAVLKKAYPAAKLYGISEAGTLVKPEFRLCAPELSAADLSRELASGKDGSVLDIPVLEYCRCKGLYGVPGRLENIDRWISSLFDTLKPRRFAHSLSVAWTAKRLALIHGLDPLKAEQAGLLHDCAKCLPLSEMQKIARQHALTDDPEFLESTALLHSVVGAQVAEDRYGMTDPEVLEAIRYHNTGHEGMSRLAMCVCLADSIEPLRYGYSLLDEVRPLADISLERAMLVSLEKTAEHVLSLGYYLHPRTENTIRWLESLPENQ
ncbi:MAG: bis(5'-nucleosyl)-tetraphosphatase (symmetrical) YqeK [Clostridia bacterium]|nr:bis(5'-nucleosyl)-tetraphosphatase (symmetrical) YqeK [Clostridia bacterium]